MADDGENDGPGDRVVYQVEESQPGNTYQAFCPELILRSEEHTAEIQSRTKLVCRVLLEKKNPPRDTVGGDCPGLAGWV